MSITKSLHPCTAFNKKKEAICIASLGRRNVIYFQTLRPILKVETLFLIYFFSMVRSYDTLLGRTI